MKLHVEEVGLDPLKKGAEALGVPLDYSQLEQFRWYYEEVTDWNRRVNLTSVTGWEQFQVRHFVDSLSVSAAVPPALLATARVLDVGSGAGFPGLPLKIAFPGLRMTLLEATAKKAAFLEHIIEALALPGVDVIRARAESAAHDPQLREAFDLVLSRAVAPLSVLAELTLPFGRVGSLVVAHKKTDIDDEIQRAQTAIEVMGGRLKEAMGVATGGLLMVLEKLTPTPVQYPRRPGIPSKRPLRNRR